MRRFLLAVVVVVLALSTSAMAAQISGNYIEARTASVWVGACFANSEMGLVGQEAVVGWHVKQGAWNGTPLAGLSVAGIVRAADTLGLDKANPASAIVIVDQRATAAQQQALVQFARASAPALFTNVVEVRKAPIEFASQGRPTMDHAAMDHTAMTSRMSEGPTARLVVGDVARVETREIRHNDATCANPEVYYQPLAKDADATPAFAIANEFHGTGLGEVWSNPNRPSAYVGTFSY